MRRRDLIFAGLGVAALGASEALKPKERLLLLQGDTIKDSLPVTFPGWSSAETSDLVGPEQAGRVARALYSELVSRVYFDEGGERGVMLLAAYGDTQSDLLQLHRPEFCYPAVGFSLEQSKPGFLPLGGGAMLPVRRVVAVMSGRRENIVYWTRIGEDLPRSAKEQRENRIANSIEGFVPDGILMRMSTVGDTAASFAMLDAFVPAFLRAVRPRSRKVFIGTDLGRRLV